MINEPNFLKLMKERLRRGTKEWFGALGMMSFIDNSALGIVVNELCCEIWTQIHVSHADAHAHTRTHARTHTIRGEG